MTDPTYFARDRYDLPLPFISVNSQLAANETTVLQSDRNDIATERKRSIFQALSQVFAPLGVRFEFAMQHVAPLTTEASESSELTILQLPERAVPKMEYRLWVRCYAPSSLDSQLIAEPLSKALRAIDLQDFQEAIVHFSRFSGKESARLGNRVADWRLRIDLVPTEVKLQNWARWGDVQAITRLLDLALAPEGIQVSTRWRSLTLQIFCTVIDPSAGKFPAKKITIDTIAPLLIFLSPQGIQGATIHGMATGSDAQSPPVWIHWLDLPALGDPKYSPTPILLAGRGDEGALNFILERLLNPDLDRWCEMGGVSLSLLCRQQVLHVMSEAPVCPIQSQVATTVVKVLKQLDLPGIKGVRVHGRIAGQSIAKWTYGVDFAAEMPELPPVGARERFTEAESPVTEIAWEQRLRDYLIGTGIWKPQLVMTGKSQLSYQPRFQWQPSLLLFAVGLGLAICGDLAVKLRLEAKNLMGNTSESIAQLSFNNPLLEQKLAQYQLRCLQQGVPDVLIVGSSRALRGIDPQELKQSLQTAGKIGDRVDIYNFGINGATAQIVDLILRQLITTEQLPKLVIWGDGARAFNSGRVDRTYESIALSERYRQLMLISGMTDSSSALLKAQASLRNTYQALDTNIDRQLAKVSVAYHHRDLLKTWLQARLPNTPLLSAPEDSSDLGASQSDRDIDERGFLALDLKFDPDTYFDKHTKVSGESDGDYADFQLAGNQERALWQTIDLLATRKIPLIFVNMPLSDIYLDKFRRDREIIFERYMQDLMDAHKLTFINLNRLLSTQYDRFSDPSHLNQFGAIDVSKHLAQQAEIPWNKVGN